MSVSELQAVFSDLRPENGVLQMRYQFSSCSPMHPGWRRTLFGGTIAALIKLERTVYLSASASERRIRNIKPKTAIF
jgi:hypothetical protein